LAKAGASNFSVSAHHLLPRDGRVTIVSDSVAEADETFSIALSNPTAGAVLASPSNATVTIYDDDGIRIVNACDDFNLRLGLSAPLRWTLPPLTTHPWAVRP
jgi:hypothetical protein